MKKTPESTKRTGGLYRFIKRSVRCFVKCVAGILAVILFFGGIVGCISGSLVLWDAFKTRAGGYYESVQAAIESFVMGFLPEEPEPVIPPQPTLTDMIRDMAARQQQIDELLLAELRSGAYTAENPFAVVDPYGNSSLTAVLLFQTEQPSRVSLHIAGDSELAEVRYDFSDYNTEHTIPVYGLYAHRDNPVALTVYGQDGSVQETQLTITTDVLPAKFSEDIIQAHIINPEKYQPGFTFTYEGNNGDDSKAALDANGDFRWALDMSAYGDMESQMRYTCHYNGTDTFFAACGNRYYGEVVLMEMNYLGKLLGAWYAPYGCHHDIEPTDENTILVTGSRSDDVIEDLIYEIDLENGDIVSTVDYSTFLQVYRDQAQDYELTTYYSPEDWFHMNTIELLGDDLIVSGRNQSTVICNDREGNIKWMLCDPVDYNEYYKQFILTPVGDDFEYSYTQHAPEVLPDQDGNPDTVDIMLFDNGDFRGELSESYSRMVQYRINERAMTVEQIWQYGKERTELYSYRHGDADLLENGNRLGSFEPFNLKFDSCYAYAIEVTETGEPVWECWRMSAGEEQEYNEYRLERLNIYSEGANDLRLGEAARLCLPE